MASSATGDRRGHSHVMASSVADGLLRQILRLQEALAVANEREQGLMQQLRSAGLQLLLKRLPPAPNGPSLSRGLRKQR